jgi:hypothetical protein
MWIIIYNLLRGVTQARALDDGADAGARALDYRLSTAYSLNPHDVGMLRLDSWTGSSNNFAHQLFQASYFPLQHI